MISKFSIHCSETISSDAFGGLGEVINNNELLFLRIINETWIPLRRLANFCRWDDLDHMFGMQDSALSEAFYENAGALYDKCASLVLYFHHHLVSQRAELYASAIVENWGAHKRCVGFIYGTKIKMARPGGFDASQRIVYSGHNRIHCFSYQTITTPDGLILHLYGPFEGRQPDAYTYRKSQIESELR